MPTVSKAIKRFDWLKKQHVAVAIWCEDDVLELAREEGIRCSRKHAREIIDEVDRKQNCELGISWDTIRDYLYGYVGNNRCR